MLKRLAAVSAFALFVGPAFAAPEIDAPAPLFEGATTADGETISLDQFNGRKVVLEWTNHDCPFVRKHYDTGNMQTTQAALEDAGAVWITIISSSPGSQGHVSAGQAKEIAAAADSAADYIVLDESGEIGMAYGAKTTPQMVLIDEEGVLRYDGAIDDKPSANHATIEGATNYLLAALEKVEAGEKVDPARTQPYGCSVKYAS